MIIDSIALVVFAIYLGRLWLRDYKEFVAMPTKYLMTPEGGCRALLLLLQTMIQAILIGASLCFSWGLAYPVIKSLSGG